MVLDESASVRKQLVELLQTLPANRVELFVPKMMLYINSAMSHIAPEIRADSTKFLAWVLEINPEAVFRNGGWSKGIMGLTGVLGWGNLNYKHVVIGAAGKGAGPSGGAKAKTTLQHMTVLRDFLKAGLQKFEDRAVQASKSIDGSWDLRVAHWTTQLHMIPSGPHLSNAYAYLGLFSAAQSNSTASGGESEGIEDREARRRWLVEGTGKEALGNLKAGVHTAKAEGGEPGRIAGHIIALLDETLKPDTGEE